MLQILPLSPQTIPDAADLIKQNLKEQRRAISCLPGAILEGSRIEQMIKSMSARACILGAFAQGRLVGYLGWYLVENFRGTERKGAYVPEWAHAAVQGEITGIYQALYRAAGERWAEAGCQVHAISLLAQDQPAQHAWYWNGFGLAVIDGIRSTQPLEPAPKCQLTIRKATSEDAAGLTQID